MKGIQKINRNYSFVLFLLPIVFHIFYFNSINYLKDDVFTFPISNRFPGFLRKSEKFNLLSYKQYHKLSIH